MLLASLARIACIEDVCIDDLPASLCHLLAAERAPLGFRGKLPPPRARTGAIMAKLLEAVLAKHCVGRVLVMTSRTFYCDNWCRGAGMRSLIQVVVSCLLAIVALTFRKARLDGALQPLTQVQRFWPHVVVSASVSFAENINF